MSKPNVFIVCDQPELVQKLRDALVEHEVDIRSFRVYEWSSGLETPAFRQEVNCGVTPLFSGTSPVDSSNLIPFPSTTQTGATVSSLTSSAPKMATMDELEARAIEAAIHNLNGNLTEAAKALNIGRATLYRKVKQYQIDPSAARRKKAA